MALTRSRLTMLDDEYETCERTYAELRIYGEQLDPDAITAHLALAPSQHQKRGETQPGYLGRPRKVNIGGWFLSSEGQVNSKDVRRHLDWLLAKLLPVKDRLLALQDQEGIRMGVYCVWWSAYGNGGPTLWPEQMGPLADLNLECGFDIYFFEREEDEEGKDLS